jgi:hypothetical protein
MGKGIGSAIDSLVRQTETYSFEYNSSTSLDYLSNPDFQSLDDQLVFDLLIFQLIKA